MEKGRHKIGRRGLMVADLPHWMGTTSMIIMEVNQLLLVELSGKVRVHKQMAPRRRGFQGTYETMHTLLVCCTRYF